MYSRIASTRRSVRSLSKSAAIASRRSTRYSGDWKWTRRGLSLALILCASSAHSQITISGDAHSLHIDRETLFERAGQRLPRHGVTNEMLAEGFHTLHALRRSVSTTGMASTPPPSIRREKGSPLTSPRVHSWVTRDSGGRIQRRIPNTSQGRKNPLSTLSSVSRPLCCIQKE